MGFYFDNNLPDISNFYHNINLKYLIIDIFLSSLKIVISFYLYIYF